MDKSKFFVVVLGVWYECASVGEMRQVWRNLYLTGTMLEVDPSGVLHRWH